MKGRNMLDGWSVTQSACAFDVEAPAITPAILEYLVRVGRAASLASDRKLCGGTH